ncbi:alpha/beta hydrolase [Citrobacter amalonaticus]|uniref:alpha/beta hydrolase n=1 Tax=Citrobacter amalonaticus TaxID=35703 RepID=UPI0019053534|nr:alpha/beta hydrolase [Citrobacter amalonaticus]MBJ9260678.1 alpha/beta hydrolase [Citrobacter amalonaticus]
MSKFISEPTFSTSRLLADKKRIGELITDDVTTIHYTSLSEECGLSEAEEQYFLRYPSISSVDGKTKREDTAAVFIPYGVTPKEGWPVVVWAHGTVGVAYHCAPSLNIRSDRDKQYLNTWLSLGYAIVAPDYAGLGSTGLHHYLDACSEAWSVLDGVRSALKVFPLKNDLIMVGQSQGAHAAFSSAGFQSHYAPELNIRATILTGTPYFEKNTSVKDVLLSSTQGLLKNSDPMIPYVFYIYLSAADRDCSIIPSDYFQDKALPYLQQASRQCLSTLSEATLQAGLNAENTLKPGIESLFRTQIITLRYPTLKLLHPVFIGIGDKDINVPTSMQIRFAKAVKAAGTKTSMHLYKGLDHSGTVNPSLRDSLPFIFMTNSKKLIYNMAKS